MNHDQLIYALCIGVGAPVVLTGTWDLIRSWRRRNRERRYARETAAMNQLLHHH